MRYHGIYQFLLKGMYMKEHVNSKDKLTGQAHRQGYPKQGIHFDMLFSGYEFRKQDSATTWPDDDLSASELETQNYL